MPAPANRFGRYTWSHGVARASSPSWRMEGSQSSTSESSTTLRLYRVAAASPCSDCGARNSSPSGSEATTMRATPSTRRAVW